MRLGGAGLIKCKNTAIVPQVILIPIAIILPFFLHRRRYLALWSPEYW